MADRARRDINQVTSVIVLSNANDGATVALWGDPTTHRLLCDFSNAASTSGDGSASVVSAGTRVQLTSQACRRVIIQSHESNTGTIVVGGSTVVAAIVGRRGLALYNTQSEEFSVANLNLLWIDSTVSGDQISYYYEN